MDKKTITMTLATAMLGGLIATASGCQVKSDKTGVGEGDKKQSTFTWLVYDRVEGPVRRDWEIFKEIEKKAGVKVDFQVVSQEGYAEKKKIMIATNTATDFIQVTNQEGREHGPEKVFLNLKDYFNIAPNIKKFFDTYPEATAMATGPDGGIYTVPIMGGDGKVFSYAWWVRKDLMDKNNLKAPTTLDEFYLFLKQLKNKYPDSYPLTSSNPQTNDTGLYTVIGRAFTGIQGFINVNPETNEYAFAPYHPGYKNALIYMNKLYSEKLLDPEYPILTQPQWVERFLTGKSLVSYFWKSDMDPTTQKAKAAGQSQDYQLFAIPQLAADGIKNYQFARVPFASNGRAISANVKDKEGAVKFLDYLMSEEGSNYLSLGIQGKTYTLDSSGQPKFMESFGASPYVTLRRDYGVWYDTITINSNKSINALERGLDDNMKAIDAMYNKYIIPAPKEPAKNPQEMELEKSKKSNLDKYLEQKVTEFVTGKTPINDETYKQFVNEAKKLGVDDLITMYNAAYKRTYGSK